MEMIQSDENYIKMKTEKGIEVKLIFNKEGNSEIENMITNNLLMSYEQRMKKSSS